MDLPEAEEKALNLALNSQAISGEWTESALALVEEVAKELPELSAALRMGDLDEALRDLFPGELVVAEEDEVCTIRACGRRVSSFQTDSASW